MLLVSTRHYLWVFVLRHTCKGALCGSSALFYATWRCSALFVADRPFSGAVESSLALGNARHSPAMLGIVDIPGAVLGVWQHCSALLDAIRH